MNPITLQQPARVIFGNGCAKDCVEILAERGAKRTLLVTSKSVRPQIEFLVEALRAAKIEVAECRPIPPEPTLNFFETILHTTRAEKIDSVLGIGGGSAMDVAKLTAAFAGSSQRISEAFGVNQLHGRGLFVVCLPTTAGTGSEVSPIAVLLDETEELKKSIVSRHLVPDAAVIDPMLTLSAPADLTAATGLDALVHCIEAYANKFAHPITDNFALRGIKLISENLYRAVRDGRNVEARAAVMLGSYYGGLCLGPVGTAAVHALSYPLGGKFRIAHGISNAVLLPEVLRFNLATGVERYAQIAAAAGIERDGYALGTAQLGIERFVKLSRDCGAPQKLSELKIPREAIPAMAKSALQVQRLLKNNLRSLTESDAIQIYEATF
ncbi:MAG TPA: iron-containing alcohol dehydrogenase [Verrucomicrobiae bacterium]|jgi:alcohol dehydrogenase class IV